MKLTTALPVLLLSFDQLASASFLNSVASGDWGNPASWTPAGSPDLFAFDNATIEPGNAINYNGSGSSFPGGNLAIANGNTLTINGGSLTQNWVPGAMPPFGTAIAIGVSGSFIGNGSLNLQGGSFNSGTANTVAVGITVGALGYGTAGVGTVNINDGTFTMGAGSSAAAGGYGLVVGVNTGASGTVSVGDGAGAPGSAVLDLVTNNSGLTIGGRSSDAVGGTGSLSIRADGVLNAGDAVINVGDNLGKGVLFVTGGSLSTAGPVNIGNAGGTGTFRIGSGSLTGAGEFNVGNGAGSSGSALFAGGTSSVGTLSVGRADGTGSATFSGGTLAAVGDLYIGRDGTGTGTVTVNGGSVTGDHAELGLGGASTGTLKITGGSFGSANFFNVGRDGGVGQINQTGGTVSFGQWMAIGLGAGPDGSQYDISGGNLTSGAGVEVGADRQAAMNISGAANVGLGGIYVGVRGGSNGTVNQSGGTVVLGDLIVGGAQGAGGQSGTYNKTGGDLTSNNLTVGQNGATGVFNLSGGGSTTVGNPGSNEQGLFVGSRADHVAQPGSTGTVNVTGSTLNVNGWVEIGRGGTGSVNVAGAGSVLNSYGGKDFQVGMDGGGVGSLNITGGGTMTHNWWINVARGGGSTGSVLVDGAGSNLTTTGGRIVVGEDGAGTLMVSNGGTVNHNSGDRFSVGKNTGGNGVATVTGAGSRIVKNGGEVWIGGDDDGNDFGSGTLNVTNGATFTHNSPSPFFVGINGGTGVVNVSDGGVLTRDTGGATSGDVLLGLGAGSNGTMNITNGGKVNNNWWTVISDNPTATAALNIDGPGSQINIAQTDQRFVVARDGHGSLTLTNGGEVNVTNAEMHVGMWGSAVGTVNVDSGGKINGQTGAGNADPGARGGVRYIMGTDAATTGILNLADGTVSVLSATIGNNGMATVNQTGGTFNSNQWTEIGQDRDNGGHTPVYNMDGGTLNTQSLSIGQRRNGAMNMSGGTVNVGSNGTVTTNYWGGFNVGNAGPTEDGGSHGNGTFNMSGGTLNLTEEANVGAQSGAVGVWNMSGGTVNFGVGDRRIHVGRRGNGTMNITGGSITGMQGFNVGAEPAHAGNPATVGVLNIDLPDAGDVIQAGDLYVGYGNRPGSGQTQGTVNILKGTLRTDGWTEVGRGGAVDGAVTGGKGVINVTGPDAVWEHSLGAAADVQIGFEGGNGSVNITDGGTVNHNWWVNVARGASSTGSILVDGTGSSLNIVGDRPDTNVNIGEQGAGTLNVLNGGSVNLHANAQLWVAREGGSTGTVNIVQGTVRTPFIAAGGGNASLNMDGATFIANTNQGDYFRGFGAGNSEIGAGGLTIHTNGFDVTANNAMDGEGSLTKKGAGTLTLTGGNTYGGLTTVEMGGLQLDGFITGGLVSNPGTTLSGTGSVGGDIHAAGATLSPGAGAGTGDFKVGGSLTLDSNSVVMITINDEAEGQFDRIVNTGTFSASNATLSVAFNDPSYVIGVTEYKFVTGPVDGTVWGNSTLIPSDEAAAFGLPAGAREITFSGQRFWLKNGSWSLVPIPEPASTALGFAALALIGLRRRR